MTLQTCFDGSMESDLNLIGGGVVTSLNQSDNSSRRYEQISRRQFLIPGSALQTKCVIYGSFQNLFSESTYEPSWFRREKSDGDMNLDTGISGFFTPKDGRVCRRQEGIDMFEWECPPPRIRQRPPVNSMCVTEKKHSKLEKEYISLRKGLIHPNQNRDDKVDENAAGKTEKEKSRSKVHSKDIKEFLQSDSIGIDHFQKHINNVKSNSKRFKRSLKFLKPNQNKRNTFRPLYEEADDSSASVSTPPTLSADLSLR